MAKHWTQRVGTFLGNVVKGGSTEFNKQVNKVVKKAQIPVTVAATLAIEQLLMNYETVGKGLYNIGAYGLDNTAKLVEKIIDASPHIAGAAGAGAMALGIVSIVGLIGQQGYLLLKGNGRSDGNQENGGSNTPNKNPVDANGNETITI